MRMLEAIVEEARKRVLENQNNTSFEVIKTQALECALNKKEEGFIFEKALRHSCPAVIAEVKKASPSKGIISEDFNYLEIAKAYEAGGADCLSVLTEPKWFLGSDEIFKEVRSQVNLPLLRKDFTIDPYQIYEAKVMGADAVLLIVSILSFEELKAYIALATKLGMSALVETHDEAEIKQAIRAKARMIGVNNRNLKDFSVDIDNASKLYKHIPEDVLFVAESGISSVTEAVKVAKEGAKALLIGEALMKAENKKAFIAGIKAHHYD